MIPSLRYLTVLLLCLGLAACGGDATENGGGDGEIADAHADEEAHDHEAAGPHGGAIAVVGDHLAHLEALHDDVLGQVTVYVMDTSDDLLELDQAPVLNLVTDDGSAQVQPTAVGGAWVFEHKALEAHPEKARFRVSLGGKAYTVDMPCSHDHGDEHEGPGHDDDDNQGHDDGHDDHDGHDDDHGHTDHDGHDEDGHDEDGHGPHDGTLATFGDGLGHLELKLHDDKGDLELWLTQDDEGATPYDLPLDVKITVNFVDHDGRSVSLAVRNRDQNEDEDGKANLRDGKTNYFVFPGDTGADASWLVGAEFVSKVTIKITIDADGKAFTTQPFELRPHTHGAGDHAH